MTGINGIQGELSSLNDLSALQRAAQAGSLSALSAGGQGAGNFASLLSSVSGDYLKAFDPKDNPYSATEKPIGAAANAGQEGKIDRTSKLYEQALELESYFVKIMLSSMRNTVQKSGLTGEDSFASRIYEDMMYDQLSRTVTQHAGFGLADQIYLQLSPEG